METKPRGRRKGSSNYPLAFKQQIAVQANDPARSVAEVALEHGLNANMVSRWRRRYPPPNSGTDIQRAETFVAVQISPQPAVSAIIVEHGEVRIRFEGLLDPDALQMVLRALRSAA